ncbi:MAG TPA: hypothetical protein VE981_22495 [Planctomycetota bacterium]|nr:hypothetical protein [Planctomycetota bacterium]
MAHEFPSFPDDRVPEIGRRILLLLEESPQVELTEIASALHVPFALACVAVGWLIRSRVLMLVGPSSALRVQFRSLLS